MHAKDLRPGQTIRVEQPVPVAEGMIIWIEPEDEAVCVRGPDGQERVFNRDNDLEEISNYSVTILSAPPETPAEPGLNTHWLGSDGIVYSHLQGDWSLRPWVGGGKDNLRWDEVYFRARPLRQVIVDTEADDIG